MPKVVVARVSSDRSSLDILEPVQTYVTHEVPYTVTVPITKDGQTTYTTESRLRTVQACTTKMERRSIPIERISAFNVNGTQLTLSDLNARLKNPIHVLFGNKPDEYAKTVLKEDLVVIVDNAPPAPTPDPTKTFNIPLAPKPDPTKTPNIPLAPKPDPTKTPNNP